RRRLPTTTTHRDRHRSCPTFFSLRFPRGTLRSRRRRFQVKRERSPRSSTVFDLPEPTTKVCECREEGASLVAIKKIFGKRRVEVAGDANASTHPAGFPLYALLAKRNEPRRRTAA